MPTLSTIIGANSNCLGPWAAVPGLGAQVVSRAKKELVLGRSANGYNVSHQLGLFHDDIINDNGAAPLQVTNGKDIGVQ